MTSHNAPQFGLLQQLLDVGIVLQTDARRRLKVNAPEGTLTPKLVEQLRLHKLGLIEAVLLSRCGICDSTDHVDSSIHAGRSTRRDCGCCRHTLGFPRWHP